MKDDENLRIISEILEGKSVSKTSFGVLYFKHLSQGEQREIISNRSIFNQEASEKGLLTEDDALTQVIEQEMWSEEEEIELKNSEEKIQSLKTVITQVNLPSKRKQIQEEIQGFEEKFRKLNLEKQNILGLTSEKYVENKLQRLIMERVLFYDKEFNKSVLKNLYITEQFKEIEIYKIQKKFFERFSDEKISKAVLSDYFSMYLPFCEDVIGVFGQPLKDLTTYQLKLLSLGRHFLNIFKNCSKKIPDNIAKDPELLINFYQNQQEGNERQSAKSGEGGSTYFGAVKEDIEAIKAENEDVIDLADETKKRGGSLNMQQMMELHGL